MGTLKRRIHQRIADLYSLPILVPALLIILSPNMVEKTIFLPEIGGYFSWEYGLFDGRGFLDSELNGKEFVDRLPDRHVDRLKRAHQLVTHIRIDSQFLVLAG